MSGAPPEAVDPTRLSAEQLSWRCPDDALPFETTAEVAFEEGIVGQARATEALAFGIAFRAPNQHIFVRGEDGTGRLTLVKRLLTDPGVLGDDAHDRVLVLDFQQLDRPALLTLPAGQAPAFKNAIDAFALWIAEDLIEEVEEAATRDKRPIEAATREAVGELTEPFEQTLAEAGLALVQVTDEDGDKDARVMPAIDGEPVPPEQLGALVAAGKLSADEAATLQAAAELHEEELFGMQVGLRALERDHERRIRALVMRQARELLEAAARGLCATYPTAERFLGQIIEHTVENLGALQESGEALVARYAVNVLLTRSPGQQRSVIIESAPTLRALLGTIDPPITEGTAPHMGIFAGSLLRADGGYLVLHARSVLREEGAWQALTRTLRSGEITLLPDDQPTTLRPPGIKPAPVPIDVKVVLIGDDATWYLLDQHDPDFPNLFKVLADFDETLPTSDRAIGHYAQVIAKVARDARCAPFTRDAVARLVEHGARIAAQRGALTTRFGRVADIAREAAWLADGPAVTAVHVQLAIQNGKHRAGGPGARFLRRVREGTIRVHTDGRRVGELNGLAVISAGPLTYGLPMRLTASAGPGVDGPLNVEHAAALSGQIHIKSFHILTGLLRRLLELPHPLALDASIAFEQSYGGIDGDSASAASFCVLLSALTRLPVRQDLAITGAVDQVGTVLPIGAVNEKIEGFFDCCAIHPLTGAQGVVIPSANAGDLMLRADVIDAVADGRFAVHAVERIEDVLRLFFDRPADVVLECARSRLGRFWEAIDNRR